MGSRQSKFKLAVGTCILRVHVVWQFYIYETDITRIFRLTITKTNIQKFSLLKIVDSVPDATPAQATSFMM
jgi:hypothetical protein